VRCLEQRTAISQQEDFAMTTKLADNAATENAKKQVAEDQKATEKSRAEYAERMKGKPTPTQEENDIAALGGHILEHEADGSDPDPHVTKHLEAEKSGTKPGYQTRDQTAGRETRDQTTSRTHRTE
jgi:hypothetical protein